MIYNLNFHLFWPAENQICDMNFCDIFVWFNLFYICKLMRYKKALM